MQEIQPVPSQVLSQFVRYHFLGSTSKICPACNECSRALYGGTYGHGPSMGPRIQNTQRAVGNGLRALDCIYQNSSYASTNHFVRLSPYATVRIRIFHEPPCLLSERGAGKFSPFLP